MTIYRILIVEDDLDMQEMMVTFLQKSGYFQKLSYFWTYIFCLNLNNFDRVWIFLNRMNFLLKCGYF